jgi:uncharacterized protein with PQ loop repeat
MHYLGQKHQHERIHSNARKTTPYLKFLDRLTFVAGIIGPFTVLPQIYQIFTTHSAAGVSLVTWLLMFIVTLPWIFYGLAHKDATITVSFILWELVNLTVVAGVLIYSR